eukprot:GHVS01020832.1.p1 GENE.GHVS01020832.1~~GHVS01020832.1.p1  ORF type:complete len:662 (-),score=104.63 GHVS01020832.1:11-1996(-)
MSTSLSAPCLMFFNIFFLLFLPHACCPPSDFVSIPVYGGWSASQGNGIWFIDLLVGIPPQRQSVQIDTGSVDTAFACHASSSEPQSDEQLDRRFHPSLSKTFRWLGCDDDRCGHRDKWFGWKLADKAAPVRTSLFTVDEADCCSHHAASSGGSSNHISQPPEEFLRKQEFTKKCLPLHFWQQHTAVPPFNFSDETADLTLPFNSSSSSFGYASSSPSICGYESDYVEGDGIWGPYGLDYVSLGDTDSLQPAVIYPNIGCFYTPGITFVHQKPTGIMGAAFGGWGSKDSPRQTLLAVVVDEMVRRWREEQTQEEQTQEEQPQEEQTQEEQTQEGSHLLEEDGGAGGGSKGGARRGSMTTNTPRQFGLCFSSRGGVLTLGQPDLSLLLPPHRPDEISQTGSAEVDSPFLWIPLDPPYNFYRIAVVSANVQNPVTGEWGQQLQKEETRDEGFSEKKWSFIVDSGTSLTRLPAPILHEWNGHMDRLCDAHITRLSCWQPPCCVRSGKRWRFWTINSVDQLAFPVIRLSLKTGAELYLHPSEYMIQMETWWMEGFKQATDYDSVLGAVFMLNRYVLFDLQNEQIGVAPANCPSTDVSNRPPPPRGAVLPPKKNHHNRSSGMISIVGVYLLYLCLIAVLVGLKKRLCPGDGLSAPLMSSVEMTSNTI